MNKLIMSAKKHCVIYVNTNNINSFFLYFHPEENFIIWSSVECLYTVILETNSSHVIDYTSMCDCRSNTTWNHQQTDVQNADVNLFFSN